MSAFEQAGGGGGILDLIYDETLGADAASFDVPSIPATSKHLSILGSLRCTKAAATFDLGQLRFNNDSGANYYDEALYGIGAGSAAAEHIGATSAEIGGISAVSAPADYFSTFELIVLDYANTTRRKAGLGRNSRLQAESSGNIIVGTITVFWDSIAAISRVTIFPIGSNVLAGSRLTIYGLG